MLAVSQGLFVESLMRIVSQVKNIINHYPIGPIFVFIGVAILIVPAVFEFGEKTKDWLSYSGGIVSALGLFLILLDWNQDIKNHNDTLSDLVRNMKRDETRDAIENMAQENNDTIRRVARGALVSLLDKNLPSLVDQVRKFHTDEEELELQDSYLANNSLLELLKQLPDGSIWFGISRVTGKSWESDHLRDFLVESRRKSKNEQLLMRRIYAHSGSELLVPKKTLKAEENAGVQLRKFKFDSDNGVKGRPPDVSLVWQRTRVLDKDSSSSLRERMDQLVNSDDYEPVGALEFKVDRNGSLLMVTVHSYSSMRFKELVEDYSYYWGEAKPVVRSTN